HTLHPVVRAVRLRGVLLRPLLDGRVLAVTGGGRSLRLRALALRPDLAPAAPWILLGPAGPDLSRSDAPPSPVAGSRTLRALLVVADSGGELSRLHGRRRGRALRRALRPDRRPDVVEPRDAVSRPGLRGGEPGRAPSRAPALRAGRAS